MEKHSNKTEMHDRSNNILPFEKDRRIYVIRIVKIIVLFILMFSIGFSLYLYQDDINPQGIKRLTSFFKAGLSGFSESLSAISYTKNAENKYAVTDAGIAVFDGDYLKVINSAGQEDLAIQLNYSRPALCSCDKYIMAYDRGGTSFCVSNGYSELFRSQTTSPIIKAYMNQNGYFAVITEEEGYKAAVTLYDKKQKQLFKWCTSEYYVSDVSISSDNKDIACACYYIKDNTLYSKLVFFEAGSEKVKSGADLGETYILNTDFISNGTVCAMTDKKTFVYTTKGEKKGEVDYGDRRLCAYASSSDGYSSIVLYKSYAENSVVAAVGEKGKILGKAEIKGQIIDIASRGDRFAVLTDNKIYCFGKKAENISEPVDSQGIYDILIKEDGSLIGFYSDHAEIIKG